MAVRLSSNGLKRRAAWIGLAAALLAACRTSVPETVHAPAAALAPATGASETSLPPPSGAQLAPPSSFEPIPNVELTTQDGRHVHFYDDLVRGRTVVVQFFFTHCQGVCPISTGKLVEVQAELGERFGRDVTFLSITLDPEHDSAPELAEYARDVGAHPGWTFLTGAKTDIEALRHRLGVFDLDPVVDADRNQHAGVLVLGNDVKQRWTMKPATATTHFITQAILRLLAPS